MIQHERALGVGWLITSAVCKGGYVFAHFLHISSITQKDVDKFSLCLQLKQRVWNLQSVKESEHLEIPKSQDHVYGLNTPKRDATRVAGATAKTLGRGVNTRHQTVKKFCLTFTVHHHHIFV